MSTANQTLWNNITFDQSTFGGALSGLACQPALGIIYAALRKAGVTLGPQRTPSPAQSKDGLDELNRLIPSLNCDRLFIYSLQIQQFALQPGKKAYTIGRDPNREPAVDFDADWPIQINYANVLSGDSAQPIRYRLIVATPQQWAGIALQDACGIPSLVYWDRSYPVSNLYLYPQPDSTVFGLELYTWQQFPQFQSESDTICMPPGYADALVLNLACRLGPQFQRPLDPILLQQARESLMRIESLNAPRPIADLSGGLSCACGSYDI